LRRNKLRLYAAVHGDHCRSANLGIDEAILQKPEDGAERRLRPGNFRQKAS
jgi:hypothetical protein